ncbi:hypothetical protein OEA41_003018 [Lepraria neglecta]|uniref:NmrA-like domain-containing protein n=1 Tax=Lepraria neglecta TaxID=209136 RepID=A0AAE0DII5_9LECA|nr:hypothetical protein OEA41_003018 [Lepraria neglecta]
MTDLDFVPRNADQLVNKDGDEGRTGFGKCAETFFWIVAKTKKIPPANIKGFAMDPTDKEFAKLKEYNPTIAGGALTQPCLNSYRFLITQTDKTWKWRKSFDIEKLQKLLAKTTSPPVDEDGIPDTPDAAATTSTSPPGSYAAAARGEVRSQLLFSHCTANVLPFCEYTPDFLVNSFKGIDAVVLTVGRAAFGEQKGMIDAAAKAGVRRIVPSEFGSDTANPVVLQTIPNHNAKVDVAKHIKSVVATYPNLTWTSIITGPFYDWCLKLGFYSFDLTNHKATIYDDGNGKFTTVRTPPKTSSNPIQSTASSIKENKQTLTSKLKQTTLSTIGAAVAALLSHPTKYENSYLYLSSFTTSQAEIFAALKKATGTNDSDWIVENKSVEGCMQAGNEKFAKGDMNGLYDLIFGSVFGGAKYGSDYANGREIGNKELGIEEESLEKVTKEVLEGDRHVVKW